LIDFRPIRFSIGRINCFLSFQGRITLKAKRFNTKMKGYKSIEEIHSLSPGEGVLEEVLRLLELLEHSYIAIHGYSERICHGFTFGHKAIEELPFVGKLR